MTSLPDLLGRIFAANAERPFLIDSARDRTYTYAEMLAATAAATDALVAHGMRRGDRVGFELPNSPEFALLYFACLLGGFTAVPLNNALAPRDRSFILEKSRLSLLVTDNESVSDNCSAARLVLGATGSSGDPLDALNMDARGGGDRGMELLGNVDPEALFSINFTSGTTSLPKGVPHRVGGLLGNAASFNKRFALGRDNRFLHVMPMAYMAGFLNTLLCPLMAEASVVLAPQFGAASALRFWEPVARCQADTFWMSPTMLATLNRIDRSEAGKQYCRQNPVRIFSATAPLPMKIRCDFEEKYGAAVIESYGLSELLLITANLGAQGTKDHSVGTALPEVAIEIRSDDGAPLHAGSEGRIVVRTPFHSVGYLDYESGLPAPETEPWFDSGDVGMVDADGYLFVTGRRKDLIIRGGFNISPRAIEEVLLHHPQVENIAVVGVPHAFYGEEVVAVVMTTGGSQLSVLEEELRYSCREMLGPSSVPDRFVETTALPLSTTGKIQKNVVRDRVVANELA
jgi:acyl-CoA synthetase (AMP-forming)/AMP-acid ligase II